MAVLAKSRLLRFPQQLCQVQEKIKKSYSLPQNQKKISALAAKHADKAAYAKAIEALVAEVEAGVSRQLF